MTDQDVIHELSKPESTSTQSRDYNYQGHRRHPAKPCQNQHQPSRGITTLFLSKSCSLKFGQNQHQPSRGITTTCGDTQGKRSTRPESTSTQSRDYNYRRCLWRNGHGQPESTSTQSRDYNLQYPYYNLLTKKPESTSTQSRDYNAHPHYLLVSSIKARININPVEGLQLHSFLQRLELL